MSVLYVCHECHRILDPAETHIIASTIGAVRVPRPHTNEDGEQCLGTDSEVIEQWSPLQTKRKD